FGGRAESPLSGIGFWESLLDQGHQITAIAGSDSHDPDRPVEAPGALGRPATVIWAASLSQRDLMTGLREGRAFVDLTHPGLAAFDLEARSEDARARMGGRLNTPAGQTTAFRVTVEGAPPARLHVVEPGKVVEVLPLPAGALAEVSFTRRSEGRPGWLRVELRDLEGALLALSNPIYLNAPAAPPP
ncbi:MAG: CehA/McbA family metallohydrolase, partial [Alphaproteobacteria bacterium]|nr:CehA/McbA family metallohydrolase [Alphaproteobacteria bacterium]